MLTKPSVCIVCICVCVCVYVCSEAELQTCCSVLTKLLDVVDVTPLLSNFHNELLVGLDSESETVCHLCLNQVGASQVLIWKCFSIATVPVFCMQL